MSIDDTLKTLSAELKSYLDKSIADITAAQKERDTANQSLALSQKSLTDAQAKVTTLKSQTDSATQRISTIKSQVERVHTSLDSMRTSALNTIVSINKNGGGAGSATGPTAPDPLPTDPPTEPIPTPAPPRYGAYVYHFGGTVPSDAISSGKATNWNYTGFDGVEVQANMGGVLDKFRVVSNQPSVTTASLYTTATSAFSGFTPFNDGTWRAMVRRIDVSRTGPSFQWHNTTHRTKRATNFGLFAANLESFCSSRSLKRVIMLDTEHYTSYVGSDGVSILSGPQANSASAVAWAATTAVIVGNVLISGGRYYVVTGAGTTGGSAPNHTEGAATNGTATLTVAQPEVFRYSGGTLDTSSRTYAQLRDDVRATGLSDATAIWTNCPTAEVYFSLGLVSLKSSLGESGAYTTDRYGLLVDYIDGFIDYRKSLGVGTTAYNNCYFGDINENHYDAWVPSVTQYYIDDYGNTANGNTGGLGIQRGFSKPRNTDWADHYGIDLSLAPASYAYTSTRAATSSSTTLLVSQTPLAATFSGFDVDRKRVWFPEVGDYNGVGRSVVVSAVTEDGEGGTGTVGTYTCASAVSCEVDSFVGILHPQQIYTAVRNSRLAANRAVFIYGEGGSAKTNRLRFSFVRNFTGSGFRLFPAAYKRAIEAAINDDPFTELPNGYTAPTFEAWGTTIWSKITRDERRKTAGTITNMTKFWDGTTVKPPKTGRNAVQKFQIVIEAGGSQLRNVSVHFNKLRHSSGYEIRSERIRYGEKLDDGTLRPIRLYNTQYKKIKGISTFHYNYFENDVGGAASSENILQPRFRAANKLWASRPDANKYYPEILLQNSFQPVFNVSANQSQTVVVECFVPLDAPSGTYSGTVSICCAGHQVKTIPVSVTVKNFNHPDAPKMTVGFNLGYYEMALRFYNSRYPGGSYQTKIDRTHDFISQMMHWYKLGVVSNGYGETNYLSHNPRPNQQSWVKGDAFTEAKKYLGPGASTGFLLWFIGHYGGWKVSEGQGGLAANNSDFATLISRLADWKSWFDTNAPLVECPFYISDEPPAQMTWTELQAIVTNILAASNGAQNVRLLVTGNINELYDNEPRLTRPMDWAQNREPSAPHNTAATAYQAQANTKLFSYNGKDFAGSQATEAEGMEFLFGMVGDYKLNSLHKFVWETMYYTDSQAGGGTLSVWDTESARTFGTELTTDTKRGYRDSLYSNGDGVWLYTLKDMVNTSQSRETELVAPSYRLPCFSDGVQLVDVLDAAKSVNASAANAIADAINPYPRYKDTGGYTNPINTKSYSPDQYETWSEQLFAILGV
jgi:hypothetical protein